MQGLLIYSTSLSQKIPPHFNCVATLPCEISVSCADEVKIDVPFQMVHLSKCNGRV